MKKYLFLIPLLASLLTIACNKETEYHQTRFLRPGITALRVYADQKVDSISFETTESYELSSNASWCIVPDEYKSLKNPYTNAIILCYAWLQFEANTTGSNREAIIHLGAGDYSIDAYVVQVPYLCVTSPARLNEQLLPLTCAADAESAKLCFTTFDSWTLTTEADWLTIGEPNGFVVENKEVTLTLQPNTTTADREATVVLTSRGVAQNIIVKQLKPASAE